MLVASLKHKIFKMIIDGILTLPLVLPPTVAGFFLLWLFGTEGPFGRFFIEFFGVKVVFSPTAAVLAASVIAFPLMYRAARGAIEQTDPVYAAAARTLGMSERRIWSRVILPQAAPGIAGGAILAFARALGEFGATAMVAGNIAGRTRTVPLAIYSETAAGNFDAALNYVIIIMIISFIIVAMLNYFSK